MAAAVMTDILLDMAPILDDIRNGSWFAAPGDPLLGSEVADAKIYLKGLGLTESKIRWAPDWKTARGIIRNPGWNPGWWQAEEKEKARLSDLAARRIGESACLKELSDVMALSVNLHGPAAVAAARGGVSDPGLIRAAAGAASQASHLAALAKLAGEGPDHAFAAKFRLFVAGRWPLCAIGSDFYLF